ncbi:MAG TPA: glycoside hydrolase family 3 C-terminal domain-containing protein [Rhizomicrobium sp.]|nr:glycoside hydrolase family 3 C-terminal domain-containing protein [Rhizomicrobium sp.]
MSPALAAHVVSTPAQSAADKPWMNLSLSPDARAALIEQQLTEDEKLTLVRGYFAVPIFAPKIPVGAIGSAGYVPGIPRLGIPALQESDASLGVANPLNVRPGDGATALPSGLATAATFDPQLAYEGGAMIGNEAWRKGFNVLLAGGVDLARDPRNGRNFEYAGEDPLLAGEIVGAAIAGIQSQHVISTAKHYAVNDQETGRFFANSKIDEAAMRESDLLAFELAIERGQPGSVMCAYNLVNGAYSCGNNHLLNDVLKGDWAYPGWVMSDWGAVHDVHYAANGLDQESAADFDRQVAFGDALKQAIANGTVPPDRLSDMVHRILRSMFATGLFATPPVKSTIDYAADAAVAQRVAEQGIVLLKNDGAILPLAAGAIRIAVIGGHADAGVLSGGGSSQVVPAGGASATVSVGGEGLMGPFRNMLYDPSSPLKAIRALSPTAQVRFDDGRYPSSAAALAKWADIVIVFGNQWMIEGSDAPDLSLPDGQDAMIEAVAAANPKTVVVLQTGGPVAMPWLNNVAAVMEAWYPGQRGGQAIANVLFGRVNPSGRLPMTFPKDMGQNPRPVLPGVDVPDGQQFDVNYTEGAKVGYRWFADQDLTPLFPFGFGLSYTTFDYRNLAVTGGATLKVSFDAVNSGAVAGSAVPQVYLVSAAGDRTMRLVGFDKVALAPGQIQRVTIDVDPRLLADFDVAAHGWRVRAGTYDVAVGRSATDSVLSGSATVAAAMIKP